MLGDLVAPTLPLPKHYFADCFEDQDQDGRTALGRRGAIIALGLKPLLMTPLLGRVKALLGGL